MKSMVVRSPKGLVLPRVPGHEVAGVVDALGEGATRFKVGDRVGIGWHGGHDGTCDVCLTGRFVYFRNQRITGISFDGGYQGHLVAPEIAVAPLPDGLGFAEAARPVEAMMRGTVRFRAVLEV